MKIVFALYQCTALRYFVPVAIEAIKRGHDCYFKIGGSPRYNSATHPVNHKQVLDIMKKHNIKNFEGQADVYITVEGVDESFEGAKNYVLTSNLDFISRYPLYVNRVDYIVFPNEWFIDYVTYASKCQANSWCVNAPKTIEAGIIDNPKNIFLGSPKYDHVDEMNRNEICQKYRLDPKLKYGLIMYPRSSDRGHTDVEFAINSLKTKGYVPIFKSRMKDPYQKKDMVYPHFYDESWYPATSLELMFISEEVIMTDSAAVKEAVMVGKPVSNIHSKKYRMLECLYEKDAKKKYLWDFKSSPLILDHIERYV